MKKNIIVVLIFLFGIFACSVMMSCRGHKSCDAYGHPKQVMNVLHKASDKA